jgi:hypothetical protein
VQILPFGQERQLITAETSPSKIKKVLCNTSRNIRVFVTQFSIRHYLGAARVSKRIFDNGEPRLPRRIGLSHIRLLTRAAPFPLTQICVFRGSYFGCGFAIMCFLWLSVIAKIGILYDRPLCADRF